MKFYTYVLYSKSKDRYYIGHCTDLESRLLRHNAGATPSTRHGRPWILVYSEKYSERSSAIKRENKIKKMKSRPYIERLVENHPND